MYSDEEYVGEDTAREVCICPPKCLACGKTYVTFFDPCVLFRPDIDEHLHPRCAGLAEDKTACKGCLGVEKLHWTEKVMNCIHCDMYTMRFTSHVPGLHIEAFKDYISRPLPPEFQRTSLDGRLYGFLGYSAEAEI